jgi:hypothetical protein
LVLVIQIILEYRKVDLASAGHAKILKTLQNFDFWELQIWARLNSGKTR